MPSVWLFGLAGYRFPQSCKSWKGFFGVGYLESISELLIDLRIGNTDDDPP